jgi:hypothetical protein
MATGSGKNVSHLMTDQGGEVVHSHVEGTDDEYIMTNLGVVIKIMWYQLLWREEEMLVGEKQ